jgi:hypothetical protein
MSVTTCKQSAICWKTRCIRHYSFGCYTPFVSGVMPSSDNVSGAENQQERLLAAEWIVGFVDGERCFSVPIVRSSSMKLGWQVQPAFAVVQGASSRNVLEDMRTFFGCGNIARNRRHDNHREDLFCYSVNSIALCKP